MPNVTYSKVIHLIPSDGLGGVEAAARSLVLKEHDEIKVWFMSGESISKKDFIEEIAPKESVGSVISYIITFFSILKVRPNLLVCSLWRSTIIGVCYKVLFPWKKLVIMLHSQRYAHFADKLTTKLGLLVCDEIWCDSKATRDCLLKGKKRYNAKVISFLIKIQDNKKIERQTLDFVYWGRLVKKKRVELAVRIFSKIKEIHPNAKFFIFGPDGGKKISIEDEVKALELGGSVKLMGDKPAEYFDDIIRGASFFLNPSTHEGMGVAVIEAMQLGIVPVVTPVGEIKYYCNDGYNSLVFNGNIEEAVEKILSVVDGELDWSEMSMNARSTWMNKPDYSEDFVKSCADLLSN